MFFLKKMYNWEKDFGIGNKNKIVEEEKCNILVNTCI